MPETEEKAIHAENGYDVECTQAGQRRIYGDSYYEYTVKSDKPMREVEEYCKKHVRECSLTAEEYFRDERKGVDSFGDNFRSSYNITDKGNAEYFYKVTSPSTH